MGYKLADQTNGVCILRIEDTDKGKRGRGRYRYDSRWTKVSLVLNLMRVYVRVEYGPYVQSYRLDI
jgi:glutamyl/glutaminyl-tRNA synthetase